MSKSAYYLTDIPLPEAQARLEAALVAAGLDGPLGSEEIPLDENAAGRVLAESVWARISSPNYHASAMDGFAVRATNTATASLTNPRVLYVTTDLKQVADQNQASYLDTGDPLPDWADAVIPIECVESFDQAEQPANDPRHPDTIRIRAAVAPWSHVRPMGEDLVATQFVLPAGHTLRPVDLGAIAASGYGQVRVSRQPRVAILPTGSELVPPGSPVKKGEIIEFNSIVLAAQVAQWGGKATRFAIIPDDFSVICEAVDKAAQEYDLILLNAGASAGSEDYSARVVETLGELLVHGVAVRPGHPVILGMINCRKVQGNPTERQVPIIGVPGYPVSAALTGEIFVEPLLARWLGRVPNNIEVISATLTRKITSPPGDDDYLRVVVGRVGNKILAAPLARGAGIITSLVRADGMVIIPRGIQGLPAGAEVQVRLLCPRSQIEQTIFAIGSHDILLDLMAQYLAKRGQRLSSANVGSLGGLLALKRGEAHLAGSHLLDPASGEYNLPAIRQYLIGVPVCVITLGGREQGLIVARHNPKKIRTLQDLVSDEIRFVNRQRGSGTRVLLDYHLERLAIVPDQIIGYNREEFTHLAVAAAVASGSADCGLGIAAAAQALDLDFLPVVKETYELVIPLTFVGDTLLKPLLDLLDDQEFRRSAARMPGYDISDMGKVRAVIGGNYDNLSR